MPVTLSALNPAAGEVKMRWQEPYVTEGLNAKFAGVVPRGTIRGFRLAPNGAALTVTIQADPDTNNLDHIAHYLTADGHGLTLRRTGGDFAVALPASTTCILALYATYAIAAATTAELRSYTLAEYNALTATARNELIVLGTVVTPGSGVIPAANISHARRVWSWSEVGQDKATWLELHNDPSFEDLTLQTPIPNATPAAWNIAEYSGNASWSVTTTDPANEKALTLTQSAGAALQPQLWQNIMAPVQPGQAVRVRMAFKNLQISSAGSLQLSAVFADSAEATIAVTDPLTIDTSAVDGSYRTIDNIFIAPTNAARLLHVQLKSNASDLQYPLNAAVFRVNNFQAWLEPLGVLNNAKGADRGAIRLLTDFVRFLRGGSGGVPQGADPYLQETSTGILEMGRADALEDLTHTPPVLRVRGQVSAGLGLDTHGELARIETTASTGGPLSWSLMWESVQGLTGQYFRIYHDNNGNFALTVNAGLHTDGLWYRDIVAQSMMLSLSGTDLILQVSAGSASWGAWSALTSLDINLTPTLNTRQQILFGGAGVAVTPILSLLGTDTTWNGPQVELLTSNPTATAAISANTLYSKNVVKCFGYIQTTGGSSTAASIIDGFNIATAAVTNPGGALHITFTQPFLANYTAVASVEGMNEYMYIDTRSPGSIDFKNSSTNLYSGTGRTIHFMIIGAQ